MTRPERRWEVYVPRTERFTPAHASTAAPQPTEVKQQAIAAAPPASSLAVRLQTAAAAPPLMPTTASAKNLLLGPAPAPRQRSIPARKPPLGVSNCQNKSQMDRMLVAVDGSNEEDEACDHITPLSIGGSVRSSSASTRSRPNEIRQMSPEEVTSMYTSLEALEEKKLRMKIRKMQQMARECGADDCNTYLWLGLLEIIHSERASMFFMESDPVGRLGMIKHYARLYDRRLHESQPHDIQSKTLLKRDEEPPDDSEKEWEEEYLYTFLDNNAAGFGTSSREVLGGRRPSKPSSQGKQVSSSKLSKRSKTI